MTVQDNYKDWFWSNLDAEGLEQIPDALLDQENFLLKSESVQPSYNDTHDTDISQFSDYIEKTQQATNLSIVKEQEKYLEVVRVAANMYILQGDMRGAEICNTIETLLKSA